MDITNVFTAFVALLMAMLSVFVVPWLRRQMAAEDLDDLLVWVEIAVAAAQQLYHSCDGERRLQHALGVLADKGFDVNDKAVRSAVEAEVLKLHRQLEGADG
jgi:hypothetical protein